MDALSRRPYPTLNSLLPLPRDLCEDFKKLELNVVTRETRPMLYTMEVQPTLIEEIHAVQSMDQQLDWIKTKVPAGKALGFVIHEDGMLGFPNQVCFPAIEELKRKILDEGHNTPHSIHPGGNKLYRERLTFWWSNMKQVVVDYVAKCLTCLCVKAEHQRLTVLLQRFEIPE